MTRIALLRRIIERGVPERHDRVPHIFVNGAVTRDDGVGHRGEEMVHQRGEPLWIILVALGNGREAAHVAEQDRHDAILAAEDQTLR